MADFLPLTPEVYDYLTGLGEHEAPILAGLREATLRQTPSAHMLISIDQMQFLQLLVRLLSVKTVVEIGCFTGYSALAMALVLPKDGKVMTCDAVDKHQALAEQYWDRAGLADKIALHIKPGTDLLASLPDASVDLVFIDADKKNYPTYYEQGLRILRPKGLMLLDNMLSMGSVFNQDSERPNAKTVCALNQMISDDRRVENMMLNIGAGLMLITPKREKTSILEIQPVHPN